MKQETIYFLQALAEGGVDYQIINRILSTAFLSEINTGFRGLLQDDTIWISEEAKRMKIQIDNIQSKVKSFSRPVQLLSISDSYQNGMGILQGMQIKTIQSLNSPQGPMADQLHIIVPQLFVMAQRKIEKQIGFQLYRLFVFGGEKSIDKLPDRLPYGVKDQVEFFTGDLDLLLQDIDDGLDGRWAYERKKITICGKFNIEQFMKVGVSQDDFYQISGSSTIGTGEGGNIRISGRGLMTNLTPDGIMEKWKPSVITKICEDEFFRIPDIFSKNPGDILNTCFNNAPYLISPEEFFRVYNEYLIAHTMYYRYHRGKCLFCGGLVVGDRCVECGERKK